MSELTGITVAVVGGDRRMLEIMRQARLAGAQVQAYGSAADAEEAAGRPLAASLGDAVRGAQVIVGPLPGSAADDALYAPFSTERLYLTAEVLERAHPGALLLMGLPTPGVHANAQAAGVRVIGIAAEDELAILHAVPTAEGAVKVAIEHTETTILGCRTLCLGLGRVGISVAQAFKGLQADVTICARNPVQLARGWAMGCRTLPLADLPGHIGEFELVVSSTSGPVLSAGLLGRTRPGVVIIDLCAPPGSVDFDAAKRLGRNVIWARGQAGTAPKTSGYHEWQVVMRFVRSELLAKMGRAQ